MDVFSLTGKIAIEYSDAVSGMNSVKDSAKDVADSLEDVDDAADDASDSVDEAGDAAETADGQFDTWSVTLANIASEVITGLIDKCTDLAGDIIELGTTTETSFAQLETIAGEENIDSLKESISELSKETGVASSDLALVAYNAISAGSSADEAMDMVTAATKLGVAGFTDTDSALSVLSTVMNSYGDTCGTVEEISDSLVQVQNLGVTTIGQLSSSMGKAIATGSAYSVNLGNLESAYVSITKAGISTEEATTYLNSMLNELGDSGSDVSGILQEETGKSFTELMEDGYSLADVLSVLYDSCDGDSTALMNLWSSAEAGKASNAIVNQGLEEFNDNLETITGTSGATDSAYATMADTMETKMAIMKTNFEELGLTIYDKLEEPMTNVITFITDKAIPALESIIDNFDKFAPVIAAVTAAFVAYKAAMGISSLINGVKGAVTALNVAMSANPIMIIVVLIAALVAAFITLWNTNEGFRQAVTVAWEAIKNTFSTVIEAVAGFFEGLPETIGNALETVKTTFTNIWNSITTTLSGVWDTITNIVNIGIQLIGSILDAAFQIITLPFTFIWENCKDTITAVWDTISGVVSSVINTISEFITNAFNTISTTISNILNAIKTTFSNVWNSIKDALSPIINAIKSVITSAINTISTVISNVLNAIKTTFSNIWNSIKTTVSNVFTSVKTTITNGMNSAKTAVTNVLDGIKTKFTNAFDKVKTTVSNAIDKIKGFFKFDVELPNIKLPHFGITPEGWQIGDLLQGSIPKLGIEWYAKAMDDGMIMTEPTVFGYNTSNGSLLAGGEAGSETVVGTDSLMTMIQAAVGNRDSALLAALEEILSLLKEYFKSGDGDIIIPVYIGNEKIDELIIDAKQRQAKRSGGMSYA